MLVFVRVIVIVRMIVEVRVVRTVAVGMAVFVRMRVRAEIFMDMRVLYAEEHAPGGFQESFQGRRWGLVAHHPPLLRWVVFTRTTPHGRLRTHAAVFVYNFPGAAQRAAKTQFMASRYDPFVRGAFPVGVRTREVMDSARGRRFQIEIWYPATHEYAGQDLIERTQDSYAVAARTARRQTAVRDAAPQSRAHPLILLSHPSGGDRRSATFLCTHLSSHGYVVAALDHSEIAAPELARVKGETDEQKTARADAWIASRVPDIRFLLDQLLDDAAGKDIELDAARVGIAGHSFGRWTALAAPDTEPRIRSVVALAPGGSTQTKPGILRLTLPFRWIRDLPALYLAAQNDISLPLPGMVELFERAPAPKQLVVLAHADHLHFMDHVEEEHESVRAMQFPGELAWINQEMRPIADLCSGEHAHLFARGLTLSHLDAALKENAEARRFLARDLEAELRARDVSASSDGMAR